MDITTLVKSMSASEKQAFKKLFPNESEFVRLYDYINRHKNYDTDKIKIFLAKKSGKPLTVYTSGYLSVIKNYLKEKILECLRLQLIQKRQSYEIMTRALNSEILLEKGLVEMAKKELEKAKKIGKNVLFPIEQLVINRRQSILSFYQEYQNLTLDELLQINKDREKIVNHLKIEATLAGILSIIGYCYSNSLDPAPYIKSFESTELFQTQGIHLTFNFENKYLFFWVKSLIAEYRNEPEKSIAYFEEAIQVWLDKPELIETHPRMYLGACFSYMKLLEKFRKNKKNISPKIHFNKILEKLKTINLTEDEKFRYNTVFLLFQLYTFKEEQTFQLIEAAIPKIKEVLSYGNIITKYLNASIRYNVAFALYQLDKTKEALEWINPIFQNESGKFIHNLFRLNDYIRLYLLIHFKLGNYRFLKYEWKKKVNLLKKVGQWDAATAPFFKEVNQYTKRPYNKMIHQDHAIKLEQYLQ